MARLVFSDPEARRRLNDIVHPRVARELKKRFRELERQGAGLVLVEAPLLYEAGLETAYDRVIVVEVDPEDQVRRLKERDGRGALEIRGILQAEDPLAEKAARADDVVDNRGSLNDTRSQVAAIPAGNAASLGPETGKRRRLHNPTLTLVSLMQSQYLAQG